MNSSGLPNDRTSGRARDRDCQSEGTQDAAGHAGQERKAQRSCGLSLLCHRIAVEHGDACRCGSRCAQQDRSDGVGGVHHSQRTDEQCQRLFGLHAEGHRKQDRHRTGAAETGNEADDDRQGPRRAAG